MASDSKNAADDVEKGECDGEKVVTMMDVLKEQEDFEEDANAVLGGSDDKNCTYSKGYIKRQAIYACLTCCSDAKTDPEKRAGVCLACSLNCHENHELIELYTKRNFRCDCGNTKFNSHPCAFTPNKTDLNEDNTYNQNFSGLYCTCKRPYPDPESTEEDEMIQCIICEDWLHSTHLESTVPANDQYSEMICKGCMEKNEFLHDYSELAVNTDFSVDVVNVEGNNKSYHSTAMNGDPKKEEFEENPAKTNLDVKMTDEQGLPFDNTSGTKDETVAKSSELEKTETNLLNETELKKTPNITSENTSSMENNATEKSGQIKSKQDEDVTENDEEAGKKKIEDEEKMQEDRLLADPDDNLKSDKKELIDKENTQAVPITKSNDAEQEEKESITGNKPKLDEEKTNIEENVENFGSKEKISEKRKLSTDENKDIESKKLKLNSSCARPRGVKRVLKGATFWPSNFRQKLCACQECLSMYRDLAVLFLTDAEDTVTAYENLGKGANGKPLTQYEKGLEALSSLDRVQQINALTEYNKMKDKLVDFLKNFKDRQEIVKEEDIKAFFAGMKPKKQSGGVYFCR